MTRQELEELLAEIDIGLREADRGEFVEFTAEDVIRAGLAALAARGKTRPPVDAAAPPPFRAGARHVRRDVHGGGVDASDSRLR